MGFKEFLGLASVDELKKIQNRNTELEAALTSLSAYNTTLYGWLNNGQPVQLADNTFTYVQNGFQMNADVYTCVDLILTKLSLCVPTVFRVKKQNKTSVQKYRNLIQSGTKEGLYKALQIKAKTMDEVYFAPISDLLNTPNRYQTGIDWMKHFFGFYLLTGNTYNYYNGINLSNKKWSEMYVLPAQFMQIISGGPFEPIKGYRVINQRFFGSDMYDFDATTVSHTKTFNPNYNNYGSQLYGQSPLMAYRMTLQKNKDSRIEANKQIVNGGAMGFFSPKDGNVKWTSDQAMDFKDQIAKKNRYSGGELIDRLFATPAAIDYTQVGLPVQELMLLESMNFDRKDIANAYHIPITLLNDMSASTDNNVAAHMKQFIYNVIIPLCNLGSDRLTRDICTPYSDSQYDYFIQYDALSLPDMQDDLNTVAEWMAQSWWISGNEKRQGMGFDVHPDPLMDKIIVPSNMMLLEDLGMTDNQFTLAGAEVANNGNNSNGKV
jgi:HK97 family phage portal protein